MKIVFLNNSDAGDQKYSRSDLIALMRHEGFEPHSVSLEEALKNPAALLEGEFVALAGGDGSVRQVALQLVGTQQPLAPLPLGTANNIAGSLKIGGDIPAIIAGWRRGTQRRIDLGLAKGPWGKNWFIEGVGIGLIGRAITIIDGIDAADTREFRSTEDKLRRDLSVFVALAHDLPPVPLGLEVDGRDASGDFLILEVLNIGRAGPRVNMATDTDASDGFLDLVAARAGDRESLLKKLYTCLGSPGHPSILSAHKVRRLAITLHGGEFRLDDRVILRRDDPDKNGTRIEIEVVPQALNILLPAP